MFLRKFLYLLRNRVPQLRLRPAKWAWKSFRQAIATAGEAGAGVGAGIKQVRRGKRLTKAERRTSKLVFQLVFQLPPP